MAKAKEPMFVEDDEEYFDDAEAMEGEEMDDDAYADSQLYKEDIEPMPNAAVFDKEFPLVRETITKVINGLQAIIPEEHRESPRFKHLYDTSNRLKNFSPLPQKHRINIVGKSGAGKSSLLNSLLGRPQLAKSLAASKGCTHVPSSYESELKGQTKPLAATIEFFTTEEISTNIDIMLKDLDAWTLSDPKDLTPEENAELKTAANTAFDAFRGLFCDRDEFSSDAAANKFLDQMDKMPRKAVVEKLVGWAQDLVDDANECGDDDNEDEENEDLIEDGQSQGQPFKQFDNQDDLVAFVDPFAFSDTNNKKPALWPLVKIIKQGVRGVEILKHATLTDWPGSDDTNRLRSKASAQRVYHCDEIWIVSSADRIGTDPTATTNLLRYGNDIPCTVICTCIDEKLDGALAKEMEKEGEDIEDHEILYHEERQLEKQVRNNQGKIKWRQEALQNGYWTKAINGTNKRMKLDLPKRTRLMEELPGMQSELLRDQNELQKVSQKRFDLLVKVRVSYITSLLNKTVSRHLDVLVPLFCVSNLHYEAHKTGRMLTGPGLSIDGTGIPALRRHIFETAAPRILQHVKQYINTQVNVLIHGATVVANPESFKGGEQVQEMIASKQRELEPIVNQYLDSVKALTDTELGEPLHEQRDDFVQSALRRLEEKKRWHWCTIRAFVRRDGSHKTPKVPKQSWNEHFMESATIVLNGQKNNGRWRTFETDERAYFKKLQGRLVDQCEDVATKLEADAAGFRLPKQEFEDFIDGQARKVEEICEHAKSGLSQALKTIKFESTLANGDIPQSYFNIAMSEAYKTCCEIYGTGSKGRMMQVLETHLTLKGDRSPFAILADSMKSAIARSAKEHTDALHDQVKGNLVDIWKWLEGMFQFGGDGDDESEDHTDTAEKLLKYVVKAKEDVDYANALIMTIERRCEG